MEIGKICEYCGLQFEKEKNWSKKYWKVRKFCSNICKRKAEKIRLTGHTPWNKGTKGVMQAWNKGLKTKEETIEKLRTCRKLKGAEHANWKGEDAGYASKHMWVRRHKERKNKCEFCGKIGNNYQIHWSNVDHKYKRNLDDYRELCVPCHKRYDLDNGLCKP